LFFGVNNVFSCDLMASNDDFSNCYYPAIHSRAAQF